jgi:D-alanyl-D-alanine carboxypeptidase
VQGLSSKLSLTLNTKTFMICAGILAAGALLPRPSAGDSRITTEFAITIKELATMTESLPEQIRSGILASPGDFLHMVAGVLDERADLFVLVDKSHPLTRDFEPEDLVSLKAYSLSLFWGDVPIRKAIIPAVVELARAAKKSGITLVFSSGYRSFEYQKQVYAREVKNYGQEMADLESARPGASQHQLGTAIDFGSITDAFAQTPAGKWLAAHAWEYGFSLSYPRGFEKITGYRYESWHFRYITKAGTLLQRTYFGDIQQYMLKFLNENRASLESRRQRSPRRSLYNWARKNTRPNRKSMPAPPISMILCRSESLSS